MKRGPRPGANRVTATPTTTAAGDVGRPPPQLLLTGPALTYSQRANPQFLSGEALRTLAHQKGMSRSEISRLNDDARIREQLRYIEQRRIEEGNSVTT